MRSAICVVDACPYVVHGTPSRTFYDAGCVGMAMTRWCGDDADECPLLSGGKVQSWFMVDLLFPAHCPRAQSTFHDALNMGVLVLCHRPGF